jgi:transposase
VDHRWEAGDVVCRAAYNHLADDCRQFCWAHLLRDFQAMIDRGGVSAEIGTRLREYGQELIHHWNRLKSKNIFVFVHHEGVSPTNNAAEQALRKSVIFRKLSFGTEQKTGSQNLAVIMSVTETCRRVGRRPFDYITDAVKAAFNTRPAPKLIPQT